MKVLLVKMSSLGDIIHTLPALTDAVCAIDGIQFDWVVESAFQDIPHWHSAVHRVIPIALRYWRKNIGHTFKTGALKQFIQQLRKEEYDIVLDAQGLIKSAWVTRCARTHQRIGLDKQSAREPLASLFYQKKIVANKEQHAVEKVRQLFAKALGYPIPTTYVDYGIDVSRLKSVSLPEQPYIMFLHGTTWATKHWPESYWYTLARKACAQGKQVILTWGNALERERAERIAASCETSVFSVVPRVLPKLSLSEITYVIANAQATIAVDTGLGHIAAMMNVPTVSLYGPTFPAFTGAYGQAQEHLTVKTPCHPCFEKVCPIAKEKDLAQDLYPPCFTTLTPESVWMAVEKILTRLNGKIEVIHG